MSRFGGLLGGPNLLKSDHHPACGWSLSVRPELPEDVGTQSLTHELYTRNFHGLGAWIENNYTGVRHFRVDQRKLVFIGARTVAHIDTNPGFYDQNDRVRGFYVQKFPRERTGSPECRATETDIREKRFVVHVVRSDTGRGCERYSHGESGLHLAFELAAYRQRYP